MRPSWLTRRVRTSCRQDSEHAGEEAGPADAARGPGFGRLGRALRPGGVAAGAFISDGALGGLGSWTLLIPADRAWCLIQDLYLRAAAR